MVAAGTGAAHRLYQALQVLSYKASRSRRMKTTWTGTETRSTYTFLIMCRPRRSSRLAGNEAKHGPTDYGGGGGGGGRNVDHDVFYPSTCPD